MEDTKKILNKEFEKLFREPEENRHLDIIERYEKQRDRLIKFIETEINYRDMGSRENTYVDRDGFISQIKIKYQAITDCVNYYLDGEFSKCVEVLSNAFFKNYKDKHYMGGTWKYFRMRENPTYRLFKPSEMFHIPFQKRGLISNQRFSISGSPCLYLGTSIYGCWEAIGRPNIDTCNIIAFKQICETLDFLDLTIYKGLPTVELDVANFYNLVLRLAVSLPVKNSSDIFKPEYIIPQTVLQYIITEANHGGRKFSGIKYTSTVFGQSEDLFKREKLLENYVLPIVKSRPSGLCNDLLEKFHSSEVTSLVNEKLKAGSGSNLRWGSFGSPSDNPSNNLYEYTDFGILEGIMKKREFKPITYTAPLK